MNAISLGERAARDAQSRADRVAVERFGQRRRDRVVALAQREGEVLGADASEEPNI